MNKVDYIIVGQGLAGSILAHQLIRRGKQVLVLDNSHQNSASRVAAGIINPITGPRLSLDDNFPLCYQQAKSYYAELQTDLNLCLWTDLQQQRSLKNEQQQNYYRKRLENDAYRSYLGKAIDTEFLINGLSNIEVKQSAIVNSKALLNNIRDWLKQQHSYQALNLTYEQIEISDSGVHINQLRAANIIFCEGYKAVDNPWLKELPFLLSKGEILTVETNTTSNYLLNWGNWLVTAQNQTKLGSNYEWDNLNLVTNEEVKNNLLKSLTVNTSLEVNVTNHEVGIRPTTKHRKPFLGQLSNLQNAYCFNGFGSKGCLLIPYYAELMSNYLCGKIELPEELSQWL